MAVVVVVEELQYLLKKGGATFLLFFLYHFLYLISEYLLVGAESFNLFGTMVAVR